MVVIAEGNEGEANRVFENALAQSPARKELETAKGAPQEDLVSLMNTEYDAYTPDGNMRATASAPPTLASAFARANDPNNQSSGGGDHKVITSRLKAPSLDYVQSPRLLGHGELFLDRVFTQSDWDAHISFRRYIPEPLVIFKVLVTLMYPISGVLLVTAAAAIYEELIRGSDWHSLMNLEAEFAYNLCSFALSLLLIFKTNTSYARFWEARTQWGSAYTDCRSFILKVQALAPHTPEPVRRALVRWTIALPYTMRCHLMDYKPGSETLHELLTATEIEWLRKAPWSINRHQPIRAVGVLLSLLEHTKTDPIHVMHLTEMLQSFLGRCGACERIKATPIPMPYTRHTTRFILFYTFFMPIVLWKHLRWAVFLVAPLITLLLAGIDNIGIFIENPINILPMSSYCRVIHDNVILAAHDWALNNSQDARSLVSKCIEEAAPEWQLGGKAALTDCAGSIVDGNANSLAPGIYRLGRAAGHDGSSGEQSRRGTLRESVSYVSEQMSFKRRESGASQKDPSLSFRSHSQSGHRVSV